MLAPLCNPVTMGTHIICCAKWGKGQTLPHLRLLTETETYSVRPVGSYQLGPRGTGDTGTLETWQRLH